MRSEWPSVRLGDHCVKIGSGATPKGGKESYLDSGPYKLIRSQNVYNDGFAWPGLAFISDEQARKLDGVTVDANDVLVNITGDSVARVCNAPAAALPARVNQHVAIVRPAPSSFDAGFLRWFLCTPAQQEVLLGLASAGATRNALTKAMLESLPVPRPPLEVQRQLASPLVAIEKRITLLRETNATLEAIAAAIFKSWFVDFDPVRAKAEGREPEGMDAETAALFPDEFEESELGVIPKGWATRCLYDLADYINGAAYKAFRPNADRRGLPIVKIVELKSGVTSQTAYSDVAMPEKFRITTGDLLFSWSGNPDTSIDTFVWLHGPAWLNQHIFRVIPRAAVSRAFLHVTLKHMRPVFAEIARNKQTTGLGHVTVADLKRLRVCMPAQRALRKFDEFVSPMLARMLGDDLQAKRLGEIRDTLLPRLVSGRLRIADAKEQLESVA